MKAKAGARMGSDRAGKGGDKWQGQAAPIRLSCQPLRRLRCCTPARNLKCSLPMRVVFVLQAVREFTMRIIRQAGLALLALFALSATANATVQVHIDLSSQRMHSSRELTAHAHR